MFLTAVVIELARSTVKHGKTVHPDEKTTSFVPATPST